MSDTIDRQAAIDAIKSRKTAEQSSAGIMRNAVVDFCIDIVKKLPSAQAERKTGKWIDEGFYADGHSAHAFRCSECGGRIIEYDADPFCRWCGADMRGEQDEMEI